MMIAGFITLLIVTIVNATPIDDKANGRCTWTRQGNDYRPERVFQGVWGRFSDGSIKCFSPGNNYQTPKPRVETHTETCKEICHEETIETCKEHCHWKWECNHKCNKWYNWHKVKKCHECCKEETKEVCETVCE